MSGNSKESSQSAKLNQIIQNFFSKSAQVIVHSRISVNPVYNRGTSTPKINKWFNLEIEELDAFRDDLKLWRTSDVSTGGLPPLVVETILDLRGLKPQQSLVIVDSNGKSWNATRGTKRTEVVLERWVIEFVNTREGSPEEEDPNNPKPGSSFLSELPIVYKKAIILFRSLYTYSRLIPTWDLRQRFSRAKLNLSPIAIGCRVLNGSLPISSRGRIGLTKPIIGTNSPTNSGTGPDYAIGGGSSTTHLETYAFTPVSTPTGELKISVTYRSNVDFRVGDSEKVLSTHFLNLDETRGSSQRMGNDSTGSLPRSIQQRRKGSIRSLDPSDASPRTSQSPVALQHQQQQHITSPISNSPRPSVSFVQPFRSSSLSGSPSNDAGLSPTYISTIGSGSNSGAARASSFSRVPSNVSMAALRIPIRSVSNASTSSISGSLKTSGILGTTATENAISSSVSSGSSLPRFSSSFGSRGGWSRSGSVSNPARSRPVSTISNGASSISSSPLDPGSGIYLPSNDIGEFVRMVDSTVGSSFDKRFSRERTGDSSSIISGGTGGSLDNLGEFDASGDKNISGSNPLARFQQLKNSHAALSDSLQSSIYNKSETGGDSPTNSSEGSAFSTAGANHGTSYSDVINIPSPMLGRTGSYTPSVPSRLSEELSSNERLITRPIDPQRDQHVTDYSHGRSESGFSFGGLASNFMTRPLDIPSSFPLYEGLNQRDPLGGSIGVAPEDTADLRRQSFGSYRDRSLPHTTSSPRSSSTRNRLSYYLNDDHDDLKGISVTKAPAVASKSTQHEGYPHYGGGASNRALQHPGAYDDDDEEDLLFAMSDMHMVHERNSSNPGKGSGTSSKRTGSGYDSDGNEKDPSSERQSTLEMHQNPFDPLQWNASKQDSF